MRAIGNSNARSKSMHGAEAEAARSTKLVRIVRRVLFPLGLASLVAGALSGTFEPDAEQVSAAAPALATPRGLTTSCQGSSTTDVITTTLRTCDETEIVVRAEVVCPVCPGGINVVFIFPELVHDLNWLRQEAFGVIDVLQARSRDEYLNTDIRVAVIRYNEMFGGATTRLYLTDNVAAARGAVNVMEDLGCFPLLGFLDGAVVETQKIIRDAHEEAGLGDDDRTCDYAVLFIEGTGPEGMCAGFNIGLNAARAIRAAKNLERSVDELLIGCPGADGAHCEGPRGISSNPRNYTEAPRVGVLPRRLDDVIEALVDPMILRRVTIRQDLPPSVTYVADSAAPTPGVVTASAEGTRLEWMWERPRVEGEHEVRYRVAPPEATGIYTVTGSLEIVDEMNRRRDVPMTPAVFGVDAPCFPPATETPIPSATPTTTPSRTPTTPPTATATATATSTREPQPLFLPIALGELCDESRRAADVVLVIDASTSMLEATGAGRTKLEAALGAARTFIGTLNLAMGRDRAAIVSFNSGARIVQPLTDGRGALEAALASIDVAQQTCLPCAIEVGVLALGEDEVRVSTRTLIVLTDGRSNPRPASEAVDRAADAKADAVLIFTIGIGEELDVDALEAIASEPDYFFRSADAGDLDAIYAEIGSLIPCPTFWPRP